MTSRTCSAYDRPMPNVVDIDGSTTSVRVYGLDAKAASISTEFELQSRRWPTACASVAAPSRRGAAGTPRLRRERQRPTAEPRPPARPRSPAGGRPTRNPCATARPLRRGGRRPGKSRSPSGLPPGRCARGSCRVRAWSNGAAERNAGAHGRREPRRGHGRRDRAGSSGVSATPLSRPAGRRACAGVDHDDDPRPATYVHLPDVSAATATAGLGRRARAVDGRGGAGLPPGRRSAAGVRRGASRPRGRAARRLRGRPLGRRVRAVILLAYFAEFDSASNGEEDGEVSWTT